MPNGPCDLRAPSPCGQREWELSARAVALAPSLDFYRFVRTLKDKSGNPVEVFFVTGRYEDPSERNATEANLRREGYDTWSRLYLRPESTRMDEVSTYKGYSRKDIEKTHKIIANLGDQYSDLIGEPSDDHAEKCFKLPNPFYFIKPGLPAGGLKCLQH
jgi:predicted secreted acid phosphatase